MTDTTPFPAATSLCRSRRDRRGGRDDLEAFEDRKNVSISIACQNQAGLESNRDNYSG
ncbi:hypothetical protein P152DRAFT_454408 [Eremomyces bilateralis CBS 781.70]|uniref:Uncharacterized protein n=1 Tax=Eremomyces bilateralis CBS 781.70 TaxID=1392243 RepID=A0A6G1GDR0_9PEZI|nr:uncharacterized protein P152DRAFT_454408 [Eremomyces bilateralis CBS 781.70]KAF1816162.1 hypothetical protein P152DRAFT_454408 [Eremomyces bilateralis CBS 781.70]